MSISLVAGRKSPERERVELILRRLLDESVWDSPFAQELLEGYRPAHLAMIDLLFGASGSDAIPSLPKLEGEAVLHHLERMMDKEAAATHAETAEGARLEAKAADLRRWTGEADAWKRPGEVVAALRSVKDASHASVAQAAPATSGDDAPLDKSSRSQPGTSRKRRAPRFSDLWMEFQPEKREIDTWNMLTAIAAIEYPEIAEVVWLRKSLAAGAGIS